MNPRHILAHVRARDVRYGLWRASPTLLRGWLRLRGIRGHDAYLAMQKTVYEARARVGAREYVVGMFEQHERYDYEGYLLAHGPHDPGSCVALDFGCGPGRMIQRMARAFQRCDGIDIAAENLRQARVYCAGLRSAPQLYLTEGQDLHAIPSDRYDLVYSTICLQHIPVHEVRLGIIRDMRRVLRRGGRLALQMALTDDMQGVQERARAAGYRARFAAWGDNVVDAEDTNGLHDVAVTEGDFPRIRSEVEELGFHDVQFAVAPPPHATHYTAWVYIYAGA